MTKAVFQLEALTCPSCIKKIETAVATIDGINSVKVLFNAGKVKTEFNESVIEADRIAATIEKLGYEVKSKKIS